MKYTANYGFRKPEDADPVDIDDLNYNADTIDAKLKELEDWQDTHQQAQNPHQITPEMIGAETPEGAQGKANEALLDAKDYTDGAVSAALTDAQNYADNVADNALGAANAYTNAVAEELEGDFMSVFTEQNQEWRV